MKRDWNSLDAWNVDTEPEQRPFFRKEERARPGMSEPGSPTESEVLEEEYRLISGPDALPEIPEAAPGNEEERLRALYAAVHAGHVGGGTPPGHAEPDPDDRASHQQTATGEGGIDTGGGSRGGCAARPASSCGGAPNGDRKVAPGRRAGLSALCLSGGGIRSATFCLGVIQSLAKAGELAKFDYLSTVSGGGYIGSWLSGWIKAAGIGKVAGDLGNAPSPCPSNDDPVANLRKYSNYLAPRKGWSADTWSLGAIYLRNLLLNWAVLVPVIFAVLLFPQLNAGLLEAVWSRAGRGASLAATTMAAVCVIGAFLFSGLCLGAHSKPPKGPPGGQKPAVVLSSAVPRCEFLGRLLIALGAWLLSVAWPGLPDGVGAAGAAPVMNFLLIALGGLHISVLFLAPVLVAGALMAAQRARANGYRAILIPLGMVVGLIVTAIIVVALARVLALFRAAAPEMGLGSPSAAVLATFAVPAGLLLYAVVGAVWTALTALGSTEADREWWGFSSARAARWAVIWAGVHVVALFLPGLLLRLGGGVVLGVAGVGGLSGIATAFGGYLARRKGEQGLGGGARAWEGAKRRALQLGAFLFLVLFLGVGGNLALLALLHLRPGALSEALERPSLPGLAQAKQLPRAVDAALQEYADATAWVARLKAARDGGRPDPAPKPAGPELVGEPASSASGDETATPVPGVNVSNRNGSNRRSSLPPELSAEQRLAETVRGSSEKRLETVAAATATASFWLGERLRALGDFCATDGCKVRASYLGFGGALAWFGALLVGALALSAFLGVNRFSLHALYANRLIRAYLGATRPSRSPDPSTGFDEDDNFPMAELAPRPLHVINAALNLPRGKQLEWQQRKARSFTISRLHVGSWGLGFRRTETYAGSDGISLGRAMAISGAAVNANMGYHSSSLVAAVLTFFNARLGWWLPNPGPGGKKAWARKEPHFGLRSLLRECLGRIDDEHRFVNVSDGGHFDNLGLYEMVRRRCRTILVVDASADPEYRYEDLAATVRKIRTDLGIPIDFPDGCAPVEGMAPSSGYTVASIGYPAADGPSAQNGVLVYVKPALTGGEPLDVVRYALDHGTRGNNFPHQSTADQFFDEAQFESYRMLGEHIGARALNAAGSLENLRTGNALKSLASGILFVPPGVRKPVPDATSAAREAAREGLGEATKLVGASSAGGALGSIKKLGPASLLAGTLAAGGVLGVAGTVALQPEGEVRGQLRLEPGAENLLRAGLGVNVGDAKVGVETKEAYVPVRIGTEAVPVYVGKAEVPVRVGKDDRVPVDVGGASVPLDKSTIPEKGLPLNVPQEGLPLNVPAGGVPLNEASMGKLTEAISGTTDAVRNAKNAVISLHPRENISGAGGNSR